MTEVIGLRFKRAGRVYYFESADIAVNVGDWVVVETERGPELGMVVISPKQVLANEITEPLKPVLRIAEAEDFDKRVEFKGKEQEALEKCHEISSRLDLPMKFISAEYNLDGSRLTVFFSAEGRVDFRDLLKELTAICKTRIELRQVGPRDEAKLIGGYGRCGRPLCCMTYLSEFNPVSIRMAKEQDLPLNPMKISGVCGRLLCCLSYEGEQYRIMKEKLPPIGQRVVTPMGIATVVGGNPLKETVFVRLESEATVEFPIEDVKREGERPSKKEGA
jgi:cell fate regulator YaaT (PSP1 superfamily)